MTSEPISQAQPNEVEQTIDLDHEHTPAVDASASEVPQEKVEEAEQAPEPAAEPAAAASGKGT